MKQGAGRCLAVLVLAFLAVILVAAPPEHRAEAQGPNTPATGEVTVTGTARVGETLTADASSIADADGLSDRNFTLVWMAGATSNPSEATIRIFSNGERYHVDPSDAGLMVMVAAKFFDDAGNAEVVVSAPTAVVAPTAPGPPVNLTASSKPHGNLSVRWLSPFWRIEDWLADRPSLGDGGSDITGYKVQWKLSTGSWTVPADVSEETVPADVSEGTTTEETHTITNLTGGQTYTLRVIATNAIGDSQPSGEITRAINRFPTGIPTLTGTPRVGEVLTIGTSGITDEDGLTNPGFSYAWLVEPEPPNVILSRLYSQPNWLVRPVDVGRTIEAVVFFVDDAGFNETLRSTPTTVVAPSSPDPPRNLRASPGGGGALNLEWEAPTWSLAAWLNGATDIGDGGSPITGYTVQWREAAGGWANPADVSQAVVTGRTSHTIPNLTNGVPYAIRVIATTAVGDSEPSAEVEATPSLAPPTPIILPPIGGGGGGPSGPTPSDEDFEWNVERDIEELDPGHGSPSGLWSDSTTLWVLENGDGADDAIYASTSRPASASRSGSSSSTRPTARPGGRGPTARSSGSPTVAKRSCSRTTSPAETGSPSAISHSPNAMATRAASGPTTRRCGCLMVARTASSATTSPLATCSPSTPSTPPTTTHAASSSTVSPSGSPTMARSGSLPTGSRQEKTARTGLSGTATRSSQARC